MQRSAELIQKIQSALEDPRSARMIPLHIKTPCIRSVQLSELLGKPVFLKLECLQPSGSFKDRGMGHLCSTYKKRGAKVVCGY